MDTFLTLCEVVGFYGLAIYLILKKNERGIFYLPALFFIEKIYSSPSPAWLYYGTIALLVLIFTFRNGLFFRNNIYAFLLIVYFLFLLNKSSDLALIRPFVFSVLCLFILIAVIPSIYQKFSREVIFNELSNASLLILAFFIINSLAATFYKFSPMEMYGIKTGILFGHLWAAAFNTLPIALFLVFFKGVSEKKLLYIIICIVSLFFIMLTLRRTVMVLSAFAVVVCLMTLMTQQKAKLLVPIVSVILITGYIIYNNTDFLQEFNNRVELRKLDQRELAEEKRFIEYSLLYDDMFVYEAYSPWFGFELFNSAGNYGKGFLDDRSLHGDIPNLLHSSGLVGVTLYLLMIGTVFRRAISAAKKYQDKLIILFCAVSFLVYTVTGRYTEVAATLLLFLVLMLPLSKNEPDIDESQKLQV